MSKSVCFAIAIFAACTNAAVAEEFSSAPAFSPIISMGGNSAELGVFLPPVSTLSRPGRGEGSSSSGTFALSLGGVNSALGNVSAVSDPEPTDPAPVVPPAAGTDPEEPAPQPEPEPQPEPAAPAAVKNSAVDALVFANAFDRAVALRSAVRADNVNGHNLWVVAEGARSRREGGKTVAASFTLGADTTLDGITIGTAFTAASGNTYAAARDEFSAYGASVYAKTELNGFGLTADAGVVTLKSDLGTGKATTNVWSAGLMAEKSFAINAVEVTPFASIDAYRVIGKSFEAADTQIEKSSAAAVESQIGAKVAAALKTTNGMKVTPTFTLAVVPSFGDKRVTSVATSEGNAVAFDSNFTDSVRGIAKMSVTIEKDAFSLKAEGAYLYGRDGHRESTYQARACYAF